MRFGIADGGCGQTYELQSITVAAKSTGTASTNLEGIGSEDSLIVTAHFSNTKTEDVTTRATFQLGASSRTDGAAPLTAVTLDKSGILKAVDAACTWHAAPTDSKLTTFDYSTEPYTVTVNFNGFTTQAFVSVASAAGCYDGQSFKAPSGFTETHGTKCWNNAALCAREFCAAVCWTTAQRLRSGCCLADCRT